jgi:hypothetical protein
MDLPLKFVLTNLITGNILTFLSLAILIHTKVIIRISYISFGCEIATLSFDTILQTICRKCIFERILGSFNPIRFPTEI